MQIVDKLFPEIRKEATLVGGGSRRSVRELQKILSELAAKDKEDQRVWAITDEDADESEGGGSRDTKKVLKWDRYHIENYLVEEKYLSAAFEALELQDIDTSDGYKELRKEIREVCRGMAMPFAIEKVTGRISKKIRKIGFIETQDLGENVHETLAVRAEKKGRDIQRTIAKEAREDQIKAEIEKERSKLENSLNSQRWRSVFRGRDILRGLCAERSGNVRYETLRNVIVNEMARDGFRPEGMKKTLDKILKS